MGETVGLDQENVLIHAGACSLTVLPRLGGKVSSIRIDGRELLQAPLAPLSGRTRTMNFDAADASGWDECLPSVAACEVETAAGPACVPDHGDLWRVAWEKQGPRAQGNEATRDRENKPSGNGQGPGNREQGTGSAQVALRGKCFSLPLELERSLALSELNNGWRLDLGYKLANTGSYPVPWSWAAHPLFAVEAGDRIVLPSSIHTMRLEGSGGGRLGRNGDTVQWPFAALTSGGATDLSLAQPPDSGIGDKLFAGPLGASENWCALERPSAGLRIRVSFDPSASPYLGLWICYGGWPDRPGAKQTCVALEPATAPVDSLAQTGPWSRVIGPGGCSEWTMRVDFEPM